MNGTRMVARASLRRGNRSHLEQAEEVRRTVGNGVRSGVLRRKPVGPASLRLPFYRPKCRPIWRQRNRSDLANLNPLRHF